MNKARLGLSGFLVAFTAASAVAPAATAQTASLGDLSKKEAERRKTAPSPAKVYTTADLPASAVKSAAPAPETAPAPAASAAEASAPDTSKPATEQRDEAWWRGRMAQLREELRRNEVFLEALTSRINALAADFQRRDDPYQRVKVSEDRAKAATEMARVASEIERGRQAIVDFEEQARKEGVPPGWLR